MYNAALPDRMAAAFPACPPKFQPPSRSTLRALRRCRTAARASAARNRHVSRTYAVRRQTVSRGPLPVGHRDRHRPRVFRQHDLLVLHQQWGVERIGYRGNIGGFLLLFAAASAAAALSESSIELALARGAHGYF